MKYKSGILFIIIGILSTFISFVVISNLFNSQSNWIKAEVTLSAIKTVDPLTSNTDVKGYYGEYIFIIDQSPIYLYSDKVSDPKYIEKNMTFYVNPNNYSNYHPAYNSKSKYVSLLGLGFCIIGIIDMLNTPKKQKRNKTK